MSPLPPDTLSWLISSAFSILLGFVARILAPCFPGGAYQELRRMCQRTRQRRLFQYPESSQESQAQKWRKEAKKAAVFWG